MEEGSQIFLLLKCLIKNCFNGNLKSRFPMQPERERILSIVLNGPSVNRTIHYLDKDKTDIMMANYAPLTPLYKDLNPQYVCIADSYFKKNTKRNRMLWEELEKTKNKVTIFLPHYLKRQGFFSAKGLTVRYIFSPMGIRKYDGFSYRLLEKNLLAPIYYNVAIMCIYVGIQLGYKKINLYGADEDFMKELSVDKNNKVMRESVHYYGKETFCENTLHKFDMEMMMYMAYMTFNGLKKMKQYAEKENVKIVNMSDSSWIDFFKRFKE